MPGRDTGTARGRDAGKRERRLASALRKGTKARLPSVGHAPSAEHAAARADLGVRCARCMDDVLETLRTRPADGGLAGRLDAARVLRSTTVRELVAVSADAESAQHGLWHRISQITATAWARLHDAEAEADDAAPAVGTDPSADDKSRAFRELYMSALTDGLADELDQLRKDDNVGADRIGLLVDALGASADTFSSFEKELVIDAFARPAEGGSASKRTRR